MDGNFNARTKKATMPWNAMMEKSASQARATNDAGVGNRRRCARLTRTAIIKESLETSEQCH